MTLTPHSSEFTIDQDFSARHIGPREDDVKRMLEVVGYSTLDELVDTAVPQDIRMEGDLQLPEARTEMQVLEDLRNYANQNVIKTQMIGQGFSGTLTPRIILRKVLENPAWYTAYTPYQPEISQGRLEALLNFQTAVQDLTGLPIANASMLDEASSVAEAVLLMRRANKKKDAGKTVVDKDLFPQSLAVVQGRADALGFEVEVADLSQGLPEGDISGVVLQQPGDSGRVIDYKAIIDAAHERGALVTIAADILSLTLIKSPGEQGADIAVGNTQRLGVPLFFGGPHAAYFAVREGLERQIPGRLVGVSKDDAGRPAYRLALQTREQHIRREKATSNICTAQALLAITASMYVVYHGPAGLKAIAQRTHQRARALANLLQEQGVELASESFFDTVRANVPGRAQAITTAAEHQGVNIRLIDQDTVSVSTDELTSLEHIAAVAGAFGVQNAIEKVKAAAAAAREGDALGGQNRESDYLTHPIFNTIKSETQMLRYLRKLSDRDLALDRTMIPLGSCTMKLNAATEMESISWPGFADIHPFAPESQTAGWRALITDLESRLTEITGYAGVSIQPNAGSQGEYAGLLAIRQFHLSKGDTERDIVLIPASAHGTNAASAVLAGLRVVVVKTASDGTIDSADLDAKIAANEGRIAGIMITYPSTHGVYDADVTEVCRKVHEAGGQVYIDGANMNALVGLAQPGKFGGDVSHLNLHKTFCIPHGGGGPGVGPVAVAEHLVPFLPGAAAGPANGREGTPVTATTYGSAGVLPISWAYVALMGAEGLREATKMALLNANYISKRLSEHFPTLYTGNQGLVAHECILDLRELTAKTGVTAEDVCKRLIDYGFHAPTLAFPVAGTLMVEPTESEDLGEIDRFIDAMIAIKGEMDQVLAGEFTVEESPLRHAPHTAKALMHGEWERQYSRDQAAFPGNVEFTDKYFPPVGRIDGAYGDRHLVCECPPPSAFEDQD